MEVFWKPAERQYIVHSRASVESNWTTYVCLENEFDSVMGIARDVITGGE